MEPVWCRGGPYNYVREIFNIHVLFLYITSIIYSHGMKITSSYNLGN
jgi:hypothetical protein